MDEEIVNALGKGLEEIKWRLKHASIRRLQTDVLALYTGWRAAVMIDYGGIMPQLCHHLCSLLQFCQLKSACFKFLKVMVIDDMIYLVNTRSLSLYVQACLNSEIGLHFVNLEIDPPQMVEPSEESPLKSELTKLMNLFAMTFREVPESNLLDLSGSMQQTEVTIPTLNGWLLGYPVIYLFGKEKIEQAIYSLSAKYLTIYQVTVCRESRSEELLSFSVPCELSQRGRRELWAEVFVARMQEKFEDCCQIWSSFSLEVFECYPQAIVL